MEGTQQKTKKFSFNDVDIQLIRDRKTGFILPQDSENRAQSEVLRYSETRKKATEQLRLGYETTAIALFKSFVNDFNSGATKFLVVVDGKLFYKMSGYLAGALNLTTGKDYRTKLGHINRLVFAIDNGCKLFLSHRKPSQKSHRHDKNILFEVNPMLLVFTTRRNKFEPFQAKC